MPPERDKVTVYKGGEETINNLIYNVDNILSNVQQVASRNDLLFYRFYVNNEPLCDSCFSIDLEESVLLYECIKTLNIKKNAFKLTFPFAIKTAKKYRLKYIVGHSKRQGMRKFLENHGFRLWYQTFKYEIK